MKTNHHTSVFAFCASLFAMGVLQTVHGQIGSGWTEKTYSERLQYHHTGGPSLETISPAPSSFSDNWVSYSNSGGVRTFTFKNFDSGRCEIRVNNDYTSGRHQFEGYITWFGPTSQMDDYAQSTVMQDFGAATHAAWKLKAKTDKSLRAEHGELLASNIYGVQLRYNFIHDMDTLRLQVYINGSLKLDDTDEGGDSHYTKYGIYQGHFVGKCAWKNTKNFIGGTTAPPDPTLFEAESLSRTSSGGSTVVESDAAASNGQWVSLVANGVGSFVEYTVPNVAAGLYTIKLQYKAHPNRGILQMAVGGANLGAPLDQYSATTQWLEETFGVVNFTSSGNKVIRLTVTGKNAAAGLFNLSADQFTVKPGQEGGAFEAESLAVIGSSGDTVRTLSEPAASGGVTLMNDTNAVGDFVTLKIPSIASGGYLVKVRFKMHPSRGIVQTQIGKITGSLGDIGDPIDLYSATPGYQDFIIDDWSPGSTSDKQISFKIVGKNPSSSGFTQCIDQITLIPQ